MNEKILGRSRASIAKGVWTLFIVACGLLVPAVAAFLQDRYGWQAWAIVALWLCCAGPLAWVLIRLALESLETVRVESGGVVQTNERAYTRQPIGPPMRYADLTLEDGRRYYCRDWYSVEPGDEVTFVARQTPDGTSREIESIEKRR